MGRKKKVILPPELPPEVDEEEVDISDEDFDFVRENRDFAGFITKIDTKSIDRHVNRAADAKEDELEALYEKRNRKAAINKPKVEVGVQVDRVDALPIKTLDGKLKYRTAKESSSDNKESTSEVKDEDKSLLRLTKAERRQKLKKSKRDAKKQIKEEEVKDDNLPEGRLHSEVLANVEKDLSAEELFARKKFRLAEIGKQLLENPESNVNSLKELLQMSNDEDPNIATLGLFSLLAVFRDIIPGYRIRLPTEKELEMTVSKTVQQTRFYESTLLRSYKAYLLRLMALEKQPTFHRLAVRCMCDLLIAIPHFNFRENLLASAVRNISSSDDVARKCCCEAIKSTFVNEGKHGGEATLEAVRLIADQVKIHDCQLHPDSLDVFLSLRFDEDLGKSEPKENENIKPKKKRQWRKQEEPNQFKGSDLKKSRQGLLAKTREEVNADLKAVSFAPDRDEQRRMQSATLAAVFETYFRILKRSVDPSVSWATPTMSGGFGDHPLLPPCLNGLGKFSHLIDLDFMGDLMGCLKKLAGHSGSHNGSNKFSVSERLQCCIVAFKVMRSNLDALNVDLQEFFVQLYNLLLEYIPDRDRGEVLAEALNLHITLAALTDQEQMVRGAASFALGQFAEYLQPEIISHYESVLPCILNALEDVSDEVKEKSYYALAAFCEDMGEAILPYLDPLMGRLISALQSSPRNLQETCMSAIGSVAAAAEETFIPYAEKVLEMMKSFMVLMNDEDLVSRARATELVGIVAMAVGRARMEPILPPFIEAAISGFALDFSELREYTHGFFSNIAEILDDGFAQYLPHVVPLAFSSCNLDDGSAVDIDDSDGIENGFGGVSSDEDTNDGPRVRNISVRTGVLDEKAAATQAIGMFALHTKASYAPYLEESMRILVRHSGYFHEDVRLQAITSLKNVLTAVQSIPAEHNDVLEKQKEFLDTVLNIYIKTMIEDDDKEVVAAACTNAAEIIQEWDYMALQPYIPKLADATLTLLREDSSCQQVDSDSDMDEADVYHDEVLMDSVSDLLPAFAKAMGSHFEPIFAKLFDPLMRFAKVPRPPQDRTMVVACLAEVAQQMGSPISGYVDRVMPMVLKELASSEATNRRNAAFCAGEICKNGGAATLKYYGDILRALYPLFGESELDLAVRDNAAGAVARMIMAQPQSVHLNQVLPVFLKALPLKEDHEESMAVYSCISNLILSSNPQILALVPDLVQVFAQVAVSPAESDEVKAQIGVAFSHLISTYGQQMQPILGALSPPHANALAALAGRR